MGHNLVPWLSLMVGIVAWYSGHECMMVEILQLSVCSKTGPAQRPFPSFCAPLFSRHNIRA